MNVLIELRPAFDGHAGIPQETRLLFRGLRQLPGLQVQGMLQASARWLARGLPADAGWAVHKRLDRLSRVVVSAQPGRDATRWEVLRAMAQFGRGLVGRVPLGHFDAEPFKDFIWRSLFAKTLPASDFELVTSAGYRVLQLPWNGMHLGALRLRRFAHRPPYPQLDTRGIDVLVAETPFPGRVSSGTQLVVRYHDAIPILMPHSIVDREHHQASHYQALRRNVDDGAWFACVSEATRHDLLRIFPAAEARAVVLPNMVSHHYWRDDSGAQRVPDILRTRRNRKLHPKPPSAGAEEAPQRPYLLMVSTLEPRKNHLGLLAAWETLRAQGHETLDLVFVGQLGWDHEPIVRKLEPWIAQGRLQVLEDVPAPELRLLYRHALLTVCPSFGEGFDFSGVEAMRCGGVVAGSDIPVHRDVFGTGSDYFTPYDSEAIAACLAALIEQPARREALRQSGGLVAEQYLPDRVLPQWQTFFETLAAARRSLTAMLAFPQLIVVAPSASSLQAAQLLHGLSTPAELQDWLRRHKTPAQAEAGLAALAPLPEQVLVGLQEALPALSAWSKYSPGTRFLFLCEAPARQLAQELPPPQGLPAWMSSWMARHRELQRQLQRLRASSVAVDVDEWLSDPAQLTAFLPQLPLMSVEGPPVPAALVRLVAADQLAAQVELQALAQELFEACTPLAKASAAHEDSLAQWLQVEQQGQAWQAELALLKPQAAAMREELQALSERLSLAEQAHAELKLLRTQADALRGELVGLRERLMPAEQAVAELQTLRPQADAMRGELTVLATQLGQAQDTVVRLEAAQLRSQRALQEAEERGRDLEIDLQAALNSCEALSSECDAQRLEAGRQALALRNARAEADLLTQQMRQLQRELLPRLEQRIQETQSELSLERDKSTRLLLDLHGLQLEMQRQHEDVQTLLRLQGFDTDPPGCALGWVEIELERDAAPHRELHLVLHELALGPRQIECAGLRLLEHGGHVGLALYSDTEGGPLLSTWRQDVQEGERGLLLLLPEDAAGQALLECLPTSDWDRLIVLLARLQLALEQDSVLRSTRWPMVAARLLRLIREQTPRLRYDALQFERDGDAWSLRFVNALFAQRRAALLALRWQPEGAGRLALQSSDILPLSAWPRDAQHQPLPEAELPMGASNLPAMALPETDRALLQALLDTLPAVASQEPALAEAVSRLQQDWARRLAPPVGRLRRLLRRLRGSR